MRVMLCNGTIDHNYCNAVRLIANYVSLIARCANRTNASSINGMFPGNHHDICDVEVKRKVGYSIANDKAMILDYFCDFFFYWHMQMI